jgi:hypothetical protein
MTIRFSGLVALVCGAITIPLSLDGDNVFIRGCVAKAPVADFGSESMLIWSRSDVMLRSAAIQAGQSAPLSERVFYWLNNDKNIEKHIGQRVEVKGKLGNFKNGEVEMKREGQFTDVKLKVGDKTEKARVPTVWLGANAGEGTFTFPSRKIDVDDVKVLGAC